MSLSASFSEKFLYKIIHLIQQDSDFSGILQTIAEQTRNFLAVDRVKIYQFSEDGSGQVIAESIFKHRLPSLLGLHFPASDIPTQTREEWLAKRQSVMIDVSTQRKSFHQSDGSQVSPSVNSADLSHSRYIPVDPCHIQYLLAMGVLSSVSLPIFYQDALWGLIAIHHSQPRRFSGQELESLELLSQEVTLVIAQSILTAQVRHQSYQESILAHISDLLGQSSPTAEMWQQVLQISLESLKADGAQLYLAKDFTGGTSQFYQVGLQPAIAFLESHPLWKSLIKGNYPEKSVEIEDDSDGLMQKSNRENAFLSHYAIADPLLIPLRPAFADSPIQSLLVIPIGHSQWMGCLILFRQAQEYQTSWAGKNAQDLRNTFPRQSFEAWIEIQRQVPHWCSQELKLGQAIATHLYTILTQQFLTALIHHQTAYDSLTQLPNWIIFNQRLTLALLEMVHLAKIVGVLVISLDRFKRVNENLGHEAGNSLLKQVASRLQNTLGFYAPYHPLLSRWHGDVFILLLTNLNNTRELEEVSQNLLDSFQELFQVENQSLYLTASIGISLAPYDGEIPKSLVKYAEAALAQAKYQGKNTYQFYHSPMTTQPMNRFSLETDLRRALAQDEFLIYYQPQINLKNGQLVGLEALLRWYHPQLGLVSPIDFIPLAEETGLIIDIGRWVLRTACSDYQLWQNQQDFTLILSVNLSIRQFQHPGLTQDIFQIIEETGMNPNKLELEITESWMMQDVQGAIAILERLNKTGIRIAIDDFGTGYSSLGKLKYLPINTLKIDKSFIDDLLHQGTNLTIIECIINLSKGLNLNVIAEGIETQEQLEKLQILGCDLGQGYWISPPIPSDEIMTFLASHQRKTPKKADFCLP
ncbi:MAG: diguanylate cyclase [Snowella sp.]|nr:MAG: diguanylate cyclase [Snowella sp.]